MNLEQAVVEIKNGNKIRRDIWLTDPEYAMFSDKYISANTGSEKILLRYLSNNDIVFLDGPPGAPKIPNIWTAGTMTTFANDFSIVV